VIERDAESRPMSPGLYLARRAARHYGLFLIVLALGLVGTAAVVRYTDQVYRSETVILYRNSRDGGGDDSSRRVASRLQDMLMSRERIGRVMKELSLFPKIKNRDEAADEMHKRIIFRARDGNTFLISYDAESPAVAQAVAARLAATLIEDNTRLRLLEAGETGRFLDQERARLSQEVKTKETALTAFLSTHPEALGRAGGENAEPPAELGGLERELARLRGVPAGDGRPDPDVIATVRRAEADVDVAQKDFTDKSQRLTDAHPDLISARAKVKQAEANLQRIREAAGLTRPPESTTGDNSEQVASIEREMARLRRPRGARVPRASKRELEVSVNFESMRHDLEQARARLAALEDKQFQAGLATKLETSSEIGQLAVLDPASRPGLPFLDVRKKVAIGGGVVALILALLAAGLRARSDDRIHDRADAEWLAGKPVLVLLPPAPRTRGRAAHG
jgi:succinoglycan biosynthesis transport protein ExoP